MRRQLVGMVAATTSLVLVAVLVPMVLLVNRLALEDALAQAGLDVQATEAAVARLERADLEAYVRTHNAERPGTRTTVLFGDGQAIGPDPAITPEVIRARQAGRAITTRASDTVEVLMPVDRPEMFSATVIRVILDRHPPDLAVTWVFIGALGAGLLVLALLLADRLARDLLRSATGLAATAEQLEGGHLEARARPSGPPEIREVGHALNRLATRIGELLAHERSSAADLSHRLRTPLTALRLEADELRDPDERARIGAAVDDVSRYVNEVITEVRRPVREGIGASADAAAIVRARTAFWSVLAEDQHRRARVFLAPGAVLVKVSPGDLEAAVDALLENVFAHTPDGTGFRVTLRRAVGGGAVLTVVDRGGPPPQRPGGTGLGLDIVRRTALASGGHSERVTGPRGTTVTVTLGPPDP